MRGSIGGGGRQRPETRKGRHLAGPPPAALFDQLFAPWSDCGGKSQVPLLWEDVANSDVGLPPRWANALGACTGA